MASRRNFVVPSGAFLMIAVAMILAAAACFPAEPRQPESTPQAAPVTATPGAWAGLFLQTPYPYTIPLPPPNPTILDGTYVKFDPKVATPVPCRRCPDYAPEGGIWKLNLDRGIFRIYHTVTGWRSMGSYVVTGNQLVLFNDPVCQEVVGVYRWKLEKGQLALTQVDDPCSTSFNLRAMNLTSLPWLSCQPPNREAGITDHWAKPVGCE